METNDMWQILPVWNKEASTKLVNKEKANSRLSKGTQSATGS